MNQIVIRGMSASRTIPENISFSIPLTPFVCC
jgi:hypothetical protein